MRTYHLQILVSNTILQKGESGPPGETADSRAGAGNVTEHFVAPERKGVLDKNTTMEVCPRDPGGNLKELLQGRSWNLSKKINGVVLDYN